MYNNIMSFSWYIVFWSVFDTYYSVDASGSSSGGNEELEIEREKKMIEQLRQRKKEMEMEKIQKKTVHELNINWLDKCV